jgi:hypothetical protein
MKGGGDVSGSDVVRAPVMNVSGEWGVGWKIMLA